METVTAPCAAWLWGEKARWGKGAPGASSSHPWSPDNDKQWCRNPQKLHCIHCTTHFSRLLCSVVVLSIWLSSSTCTLFCPYFTSHNCSWSSTSFPPQVLQLHWLWGTHMGLGHTTNFFFFSLKWGMPSSWFRLATSFLRAVSQAYYFFPSAPRHESSAWSNRKGTSNCGRRLGLQELILTPFHSREGRKMMDFLGCAFFLKPWPSASMWMV